MRAEWSPREVDDLRFTAHLGAGASPQKRDFRIRKGGLVAQVALEHPGSATDQAARQRMHPLVKYFGEGFPQGEATAAALLAEQGKALLLPSSRLKITLHTPRDAAASLL